MNPKLIYVAISGFGELEPYIGPWSHRPANNATAQAMSGLMDLSGDADGPPPFIGQAIGDTVTGLWAVIGTLVALEHRRKTGVGQFVDVAMYDSLAAMCFNAITDYHVTGAAAHRWTSWHETFSDRLRCTDGYIAVSLWGTMPERWRRLWGIIGRPDMLAHPEFVVYHPGCPRCLPIVKRVLEKWLSTTPRDAAVRILIDLGFSAGPVQDAREVYESDQLRQRELFIEIEDGLGGSIRTVGTPVKFCFAQILLTCESDAHGRTGHENDAYPQSAYMLECARAAQAVNAGDIARACADKNLIADKVREARILAVEAVIKGR